MIVASCHWDFNFNKTHLLDANAIDRLAFRIPVCFCILGTHPRAFATRHKDHLLQRQSA